MDEPTPHFLFAGTRFDPQTGELTSVRGDREPVRLSPKPARLLTLLLERSGELVSRETLAEDLWGDQHIDLDQALAYTVRQVRAALGDEAREPRFVETLPRRGYRFLVPVETDEPPPDGLPAQGSGSQGSGSQGSGVEPPRREPAGDGTAPGAESPRPPGEHGEPPGEWEDPPQGLPRWVVRIAWILVTWFLILPFVVTPLLWVLTPLYDSVVAAIRAPQGSAESPSTDRSTAATPVPVALVALTPPVEQLEDPSARAANGRLTDALLVALTDRAELEVVGPVTTGPHLLDPQTGEPWPHTELGMRLGVRHVISGGYGPGPDGDGEPLLFLQLIRAEDGAHLFARLYSEREEELMVQVEKIAAELAEAATEEKRSAPH